MQLVQPVDGPRDLIGSPVPLHADRADPNFDRRPTPGERLQHVANSGAATARYQCDPSGKARQRLLALRREVTELRKFLFELLKRQLERANSLRMDLFDLKLVLTVRRVNV